MGYSLNKQILPPKRIRKVDIRELYNVVGGDMTDLLTRLPREDMVERFVRKYLDSSEFENMLNAYENKDYRALFESTHQLKGMTANLSLTKQQAVFSEICESVRHGEPNIDLEPLVEKAKVEYQTLKDAMANLN